MRVTAVPLLTLAVLAVVVQVCDCCPPARMRSQLSFVWGYVCFIASFRATAAIQLHTVSILHTAYSALLPTSTPSTAFLVAATIILQAQPGPRPGNTQPPGAAGPGGPDNSLPMRPGSGPMAGGAAGAGPTTSFPPMRPGADPGGIMPLRPGPGPMAGPGGPGGAMAAAAGRPGRGPAGPNNKLPGADSMLGDTAASKPDAVGPKGPASKKPGPLAAGGAGSKPGSKAGAADDPPGSLHKLLGSNAPLFRSLLDVLDITAKDIKASTAGTIFAPTDKVMRARATECAIVFGSSCCC